MQPRLESPSQPAINRDEFWEDYKKIDFQAMLKKYTKPDTKIGIMKKFIKEGLYYTKLRKHP